MTNEKKQENKEIEFKSLVGTRGKTFEGEVVKKFGKRAVVEFQRTVRVAKYERFMRRKTRVHSRIPEGLDVNVGDYVKVRECRPLSKMIHSVVIQIIRKASVGGKK
jgi:small subunit ribosomal protein S17